MKSTSERRHYQQTSPERKSERGSAIVIALFVLALISVFVALAMSRSSAEAAAIGNEVAESRTLYAAQGSLETMTRNFNKVFEVKLNPTAQDMNRVRTGTVPGITGYTFDQLLDQTSQRQVVVLPGGPYAGLVAVRDNWRLRTTAADVNHVEVQLTRNILNNRIPIFQFGIFYDDDLELFRPPRFSFGGRVHSNRHFFISPGADGVYFDSRVTAAGEIVTQRWRNWYSGDSGNDDTYIKNASSVNKKLYPTQGSVLSTTAGDPGNIFAGDPDLPPMKKNPSFLSQSAVFDGNLQAEVPELKLPLKVGRNVDLIEMVKRGKAPVSSGSGDLANIGGTLTAVTAGTADDAILRAERFSNKTGIRISLADSKAKLPGCASGVGTDAVTTPCGVRLDGYYDGTGPIPSPTPAALTARSLGYQPKSMKSVAGGPFNYTATRVNGERLQVANDNVAGREVWIKIETVATDSNQNIQTADITEDMLSLGVTDELPQLFTSAKSYLPVPTGTPITYTYSGTRSYQTTSPGYNGTPTSPSSNLTATSPQTASTFPDSRSVIKIQRFGIEGPAIPGGNNVLTSTGSGSAAINFVQRFSGVGTTDSVSDTNIKNACPSSSVCTLDDRDPNTAADPPFSASYTAGTERYGHLIKVQYSGTTYRAITPFPIEMFDSREGEHYDSASTTYYDDLSRLTRNGNMSLVGIDMANLRRFLRGDYDGLFPVDTPYATAHGSGLVSGDIPQNAGWVVYVSDRRGDADFDGEFDMEDIYGNGKGNDNVLQLGEDVNKNGVLDDLYGTEAEKYNVNTVSPDVAAVNDHKYYRRGVRLINGTVVPGIYDATTPSNTRGITMASENGIYIQGNYNATGVSNVPSTGNTSYDDYLPFNTATHIPASIVADAVTILSNVWTDGESFKYPYDNTSRVGGSSTYRSTAMRFAMISGDTIASREATPNQGGISPRLNGGVHNFKRFLESWTDQSGSNAYDYRFDYAGSLINLFNSHNNNGSFKCCNTVYDPPIRNWVFDSTFLDPDRLPPGTPYFQYIQTTGFQRTNE